MTTRRRSTREEQQTKEESPERVKENKGGHWFSTNPSKQWGEKFYLFYSIFWIGLFGAVVFFEFYKVWENVGYTALSAIMVAPALIYPLCLPGQADSTRRLRDQYWLKAHLWIAPFNFVGNYFWTHYFFVLLGARYTFPITWQLNKIPIPFFFITQAYFLTYHVFSNLFLRKYYSSFKPSFIRSVGAVFLILGFAYFTAFMETFTIASVPYYSFEDRNQMYIVGSTFYALYFVISFPMFYRLDEKEGESWSYSKTVLDSLAAAMIVFILCDFWRLIVGGLGSVQSDKVPFVYV